MKRENNIEQQKQKLIAGLKDFYNNPNLTIAVSRSANCSKKHRLHAHGYHEIFIFKDAHIRVNPLGELHSSLSAAERAHICMTFSLNQSQFDWVIAPYGICFYMDKELPAQLGGALSFLQAIPNLLDGSAPEKMLYDLAKLLINVLLQLVDNVKGSGYEHTNIALKACNLIHKSYNEHNLSAQSIAKACGYSLQGLNAAFHKEFNCSIRHYIINIRLSDAAYKLVHSDDFDVLTIAYATGWNNRAYFSNSFRKAYGYPPHTYRKMVLAGELPMPMEPELIIVKERKIEQTISRFLPCDERRLH